MDFLLYNLNHLISHVKKCEGKHFSEKFGAEQRQVNSVARTKTN